VKKNGTSVNSGIVEAFGPLFEDAHAEYTITNIGGGTLTIATPVATTGVTTAQVDNNTLAHNETATLTITLPVSSPYGEQEGAVTIATNLGDFVINYTAITIDPDALNVTFDDNTLPDGWYNNGWSVEEKEIYRSNRSTDADFITQKLVVAGVDDVLTFQAKAYGSRYANNSVLTVSYSTDRVNWTETDFTSVVPTTNYTTYELKGLHAGEYYLKFTGRYASVDNILGWKKAAVEHDLYVTSANMPTTLTANYTATVSVTSLLADEEDVTAKLFFDGKQFFTTSLRVLVCIEYNKIYTALVGVLAHGLQSLLRLQLGITTSITVLA
jgi:hypothetical protein